MLLSNEKNATIEYQMIKQKLGSEFSFSILILFLKEAVYQAAHTNDFPCLRNKGVKHTTTELYVVVKDAESPTHEHNKQCVH
jgi:hypothetical protein